MDADWVTWLQESSSSEAKLEPILTGFTRCAPNYHIRQRTLPEHLIYEMVEHDLHAEIAGETYTVRSGELLWVPPKVEHEFRAAIQGQRLLVYHYRFHLGNACPHDAPVILPPSPYRRERFAQLLDGSDNNDPWWLLRLRAVLILTFSDIAAILSEQVQSNGSCFNSEQRRIIMHAVQKNQWLDPERLAQLLDYHPAYFTRLFKRSFGIAPRTWLLQQRMHSAAILLQESPAAINEIAKEIGYQDPYIFSRQFKQIHGCSPRDWRKLHSSPKQLHH